MIERFRRGDCSVLVSSQVLDEGFDVPDAEVAIVVGGTGSLRRHAQRIGRVLRPGPGKHAHVYELAVIDVLERPQLAEDEKILATPMVVKELPPPIRRIIGDLSNAEKVLVGLDIPPT